MEHFHNLIVFLFTHDDGVPTIIQSNIYIESFGNIEEANMEYKVYGYFRQRWNDSRLVGRVNQTLWLKGNDIDNIWIPDPYCYNARESNMKVPDEEKYSSVRIHNNGNIEMSIGVTLLASCVMRLENFPLDSQTCYLKFGSYAYPADQIIYEWMPRDVSTGHVEMAQFEYKGATLTSKMDTFSTGNYSTITVTFSFQRRLGYFIIQVYLPDVFLVMLSWIVFWMEKSDIGNRMALGITTILTIMFLLGSLNGNLPKVSYPKALDWYLLVSFSFVFLSLIECLVVYVLLKQTKKHDQDITRETNGITFPLTTYKVMNFKTDDGAPVADEAKNGSAIHQNDVRKETQPETETMLDNRAGQKSKKKRRRMEKIAKLIDNFSRVLFPLAFICFNIYYWKFIE
ncbi:gamma-aminobutyric acid receptor subunit alpha-6-like isoform X2 [Acropora millepora]|uniref:gamma-aminobutyric acid receptor subunit alpha-6-like isoform X2 n=1 Tax=Acropora millepora TaxID=45264 RepID=UPI001CF4ED64|nr:gamma-aminobutyric acid receptor subunit alpha-6-like isoform X2 [Acropora millepora]